jgi:type I restriction enzyme S subunit
VNLGEVIDLFDSKRIPLSSLERSKRQGVFPYYGASGIIDRIDGYIFEGRYLLVAEDGENLNSRKLPVAFLADGQFWVNNHAHIVRGKGGVLDDIFLQQWFAQADIRGYVTGSAQPKLSQANLKRMRLPLPPLPIQRKIATILSAYDELIETNNRRIALLEDMARRIHREWCVDFRFPGHEDAPMVASELGPIPQEWAAGSVASMSESIARGVTPKYEASSTHLVINQKCIRGGRLSLLRARGHTSVVPPAKLLQLGDVLINSTGVGTLGRVAQVLFSPEGVTVDSHVTIVRPAADVAEMDFVGLTLLGHEPDLELMGVGSTGQTELGRGAIGDMKVVVPSKRVQRDLTNRVGAARKLAVTLASAVAALGASRDLLVPHLMSGEIEVGELASADADAAT